MAKANAKKKPARKPMSKSEKWAKEQSAKAKAAAKKPIIRQVVIPGTMDEHDEKLVRAAESYRQAEGSLEAARTEVNEAASHLIGLMQKKGRKSYKDPDGTLITLREIKARIKIDVDKVIPTRDAVPSKPAKPVDQNAGKIVDLAPSVKPSEGSQDANGYAPLADSSKKPAKADPLKDAQAATENQTNVESAKRALGV